MEIFDGIHQMQPVLGVGFGTLGDCFLASVEMWTEELTMLCHNGIFGIP